MTIYLMNEKSQGETLFCKEKLISAGKRRKIHLDFLPAKAIRVSVTRGVYVDTSKVDLFGIRGEDVPE